jgi:hypothetical protein
MPLGEIHLEEIGRNDFLVNQGPNKHTEMLYKLIFCCCCFDNKTKTTTLEKPKQKH